MYGEWQLPVNKTGDYIPDTAKYHYFCGNRSLCGRFVQNTEAYDTGIDGDEILAHPEFACKRCFAKWRKMFDL